MSIQCNIITFNKYTYSFIYRPSTYVWYHADQLCCRDRVSHSSVTFTRFEMLKVCGSRGIKCTKVQEIYCNITFSRTWTIALKWKIHLVMIWWIWVNNEMIESILMCVNNEAKSLLKVYNCNAQIKVFLKVTHQTFSQQNLWYIIHVIHVMIFVWSICQCQMLLKLKLVQLIG